LTASYAIGALTSALPLGLVVVRLGAKRTAVGGALVLAVTSVVFGFSRSLAALDLARLAQGIAGSAVWIGALSWIVSAASAHRRGETVGGVLGIAIAGAMLGPVIGSLAELSGPRAVFGCIGAVIAALGALAAATPSSPAAAQPLTRGALRAALADRRLLAGCSFTALPAALYGVLAVLQPLRLSALGVSSVGIGAVFLVSAGLEGGASPLWGRLSDRRGPWLVIRIGLWTAALCALALTLPQPAWLVASITALAGVAFGVCWVPANGLLSGAAESHRLNQGLAFALWDLAWALGVTIGSAAGAPIAQATSNAVPYLTLAIVALASLVVIRRSGPSS
jgi:MFS family permease